jgi:hypothetical protein
LPASISAVVITSGFDLTFALEDPTVAPVDAHATTAAIIRQDDNIAGKRRIGFSPGRVVAQTDQN